MTGSKSKTLKSYLSEKLTLPEVAAYSKKLINIYSKKTKTLITHYNDKLLSYPLNNPTNTHPDQKIKAHAFIILTYPLDNRHQIGNFN